MIRVGWIPSPGFAQSFALWLFSPYPCSLQLPYGTGIVESNDAVRALWYVLFPYGAPNTVPLSIVLIRVGAGEGACMVPEGYPLHGATGMAAWL